MAIKNIDAKSWEKEVIKTKKPVVVSFWHEQCKWCKKLNPLLSLLSADFDARFAKIDIKKSKADLAIAKKFGIMGTPTVIIFCKGRPIGTIIGYRNKEQLAGELEQFIKVAHDLLETSTLMMYR